MRMKNESGRTLVEMLAVLAIISVITVGGLSGVSYGISVYRADVAHTQIEETLRGVVDLYHWNRDYSRLSMSVICQNDIIPGGCDSENKARNPWGGEALVEEVENDGSFRLSYQGVPQRACRQLAAMKFVHTAPPDDEDDCTSDPVDLIFNPI